MTNYLLKKMYQDSKRAIQNITLPFEGSN